MSCTLHHVHHRLQGTLILNLDYSQRAAQQLLGKLLASLGPLTHTTMIAYLHCSPSVLLADVGLLEMIALLLPGLARKITQTLTNIIDDLMSDKPCSCESVRVPACIDS